MSLEYRTSAGCGFWKAARTSSRSHEAKIWVPPEFRNSVLASRTFFQWQGSADVTSTVVSSLPGMWTSLPSIQVLVIYLYRLCALYQEKAFIIVCIEIGFHNIYSFGLLHKFPHVTLCLFLGSFLDSWTC